MENNETLPAQPSNFSEKEQGDLEFLAWSLKGQIGRGAFFAAWCDPEHYNHVAKSLKTELKKGGIDVLDYKPPDPCSPDYPKRAQTYDEVREIEKKVAEETVILIDLRQLHVDTARNINFAREKLHDLNHPILFIGFTGDLQTVALHARDIWSWMYINFFFTEK